MWQWSNGDPWSYENWHAGEPNNVDNEVGIKKNRKVVVKIPSKLGVAPPPKCGLGDG